MYLQIQFARSRAEVLLVRLLLPVLFVILNRFANPVLHSDVGFTAGLVVALFSRTLAFLTGLIAFSFYVWPFHG